MLCLVHVDNVVGIVDANIFDQQRGEENGFRQFASGVARGECRDFLITICFASNHSPFFFRHAISLCARLRIWISGR